MSMMEHTMGITGRKLPVYFLLDCSGSMNQNGAIGAVNEGLQLLTRELKDSVEVREYVWISLIRFASTVEQDQLQPIARFVPPTLTADGATAMGPALSCLYQSIQQDLQAGTEGRKPDFRPLVFALSDGGPTDAQGYEFPKGGPNDWEAPAAQLHSLRGPQKPTVVALGCGSHADMDMLKQLARAEVYQMTNVSADTLKQFFELASGSIVNLSKSIVTGAAASIQSPATITGIKSIPYTM